MYQKIETTVPGNSYVLLQKLIDILCTAEASTKEGPCIIMTQNIDGLALSIKCDEVLELHGTWRTVISADGSVIDTREVLNTEDLEKYRPNVVLFGENLRVSKTKLFSMLKGVKQVIVIGTTLQFPYLHKILAKARHKGCSIIHINPDPGYSGWNSRDRILRHTASSGLELLLSKL